MNSLKPMNRLNQIKTNPLIKVTKAGVSLITFVFLFSLSLSALAENAFDTGWKPTSTIDYKPYSKLMIHLNKEVQPKTLKALMNMYTHLFAAVKTADIKVVVHGDAMDLFLKASSDTEMAQFLDKSRAMGVQYLICNNTLKTKKIKYTDLYKVETKDMIEAGLLEISRLQASGYTYLKLF